MSIKQSMHLWFIQQQIKRTEKNCCPTKKNGPIISFADPWHLGVDPDSGSGDPCLWLMDPEPVIFVINLQYAKSNINKKNFYLLLLNKNPDPGGPKIYVSKSTTLHMIYTAPCLVLQVGGIWAISQGPKSLDFQGPTPYYLPSNQFSRIKSIAYRAVSIRGP